MGTSPVTRLTEADYLTLERIASTKSEYVGGEMVARAGGSPRHAMLSSQVLLNLGSQLVGRGCFAVNSDLRIRSPHGEQFYPDVSVICGPVGTHAGIKDVCTNPVVLVEVLSPSTANYDRGLKFVLYREIPSLRDYLIFHCDAIHVEHYTRQPDDGWQLRNYTRVRLSGRDSGPIQRRTHTAQHLPYRRRRR